MKLSRPSGFTDFLLAALCVVIPIALQIQITLFKSPDYLGLRINMADLIVPFAGLGILYSLFKKQSRWPDWLPRHMYFWLAGLVLLLTFALVHTHFTYGEISRWAAMNKFGGWFILTALLALGGWIGTNANQEKIELFIKTFLYFALGTIFMQVFVIVGQSYWHESFIGYNTYAHVPIAGYMVNRNAFAVLFLATFAISSCLHAFHKSALNKWCLPTLYFLVPFFLLFNASRAMTISLGLFLPVYLIINAKTEMRKIGVLLACLALGAALLALIYSDRKDQLFLLNDQQLSFVDHLDDLTDEESPFGTYDPAKIAYPGDSMRLTILADAKEMVPMHPVLGSGLGSMLLFQQQKHGRMINLIDCTPLWILVEMGLLGLFAFGAFYVQAFRVMYKSWTQDEDFIRTLRLGIMAAMACFTIMCLFHEIMYTRFVWVLLGIGLTMRSKTHPA